MINTISQFNGLSKQQLLLVVLAGSGSLLKAVVLLSTQAIRLLDVFRPEPDSEEYTDVYLARFYIIIGGHDPPAPSKNKYPVSASALNRAEWHSLQLRKPEKGNADF